MKTDKIYTTEEVKSFFKQAVEHSILDAQRVPNRDPNPYVNAYAVWITNYKDTLHISVLDEYKNV